MINDHRQCLYHKELGAKQFEKGEDIPNGWYDSPDFDNPNTQAMWGPDDEPAATEEASEEQKYPSQMNKAELIEFGTNLGLEFDMSMGKREMLDAVNAAIKGENDEG